MDESYRDLLAELKWSLGKIWREIERLRGELASDEICRAYCDVMEERMGKK